MKNRGWLLLGLALASLLALASQVSWENLLENPSFEEGKTLPQGWSPWPTQASEVSHRWEEQLASDGARSVAVEAASRGLGGWRQRVPVQGGRVYTLSGFVGWEEVSPPGACHLQLVFRDRAGQVLRRVDFPPHSGTRELACDFPGGIKVRAPEQATYCDVNLVLLGPGRAWFDEITFAPVPTGSIVGRVTSQGHPLPGARVFIWGNPWGEPYEAVTDSQGWYLIEEVPLAKPRYLVVAEKDGYRTGAQGGVGVEPGGVVEVNFDLTPGRDPQDVLQVKFGSLGLSQNLPPAPIPEEAVLAPQDYPESVRPFLQPDEFIQSDHPAVMELAQEILAGVPPPQRDSAYQVAWAVYEWISKNIEHDSILDAIPRAEGDPALRDVTNGVWQTLSGEGWCWGRNFYDWAMKPAELIEQRSGICVEHSWLAAALLRALGIPARAAVGSNQIWVQLPSGEGWWAGFSTTQGRGAFRLRGQLGPGFGNLSWPTFYSVLARPVLHEDWQLENPGMWRERHPWQEFYPGTQEGYAQALAALEEFAGSGQAPRGAPPARLRGPRYFVHYSDVTINLWNLGDQHTLEVRFPIVSDAEAQTFTGHFAYWTNHPECVVYTWVEEIENPPVEGVERWFHLQFDLTALLGA